METVWTVAVMLTTVAHVELFVAKVTYAVMVNEYVGITHYIKIANMEYQTSYLEINPHDTVVWTNNDSVLHSVTSNDSFFDSAKSLLMVILGHTNSTVMSWFIHVLLCYHLTCMQKLVL